MSEIGGEAAAALIGPLTDLVIRAGAAILDVNRGAMKVDGKSDGSPVTEADLAADRIIADGLAAARAANPLALRRARASGDAALSRLLLPDRSARRHQGVRRRPQRVHGQPRIGERRQAAARPRRRAGARPDLARAGRARRRTGDGGRRRDHRGRADPHQALPATRTTLDGGGQPLPWRQPGPRASSPRGRARCGPNSARR